MTYLQQLHQWSSKNHQRWFVVLRVVLAISLLIKGIQFVQDSAHLEQILQQSGVPPHFQWLDMVIPWLHLLGGSMLLAGLFTRISVLIQIPVLTGAVFLVNSGHGSYATIPDLVFSIVVLLLLLFFLFEGGGPYSLDNAMRYHHD